MFSRPNNDNTALSLTTIYADDILKCKSLWNS